jgi:DNA-binding NarL/FixJ family response regulator
MYEIYSNSNNSVLVVEDMTTGNIVPLKDMGMGWQIKVDSAIRESYPDTYDKLVDLHGGSKSDIMARVKQFLSCNFAYKDGVPDIDEHFNFKTESVFCPARSTKVCQLGICCPKITSKFTRCERTVLNLFCVGLSEDEIADKLFISKFTVHNHINNMYEKSGIKGKTAPDRKLIAYAYSKKLI